MKIKEKICIYFYETLTGIKYNADGIKIAKFLRYED